MTTMLLEMFFKIYNYLFIFSSSDDSPADQPTTTLKNNLIDCTQQEKSGRNLEKHFQDQELASRSSDQSIGLHTDELSACNNQLFCPNDQLTASDKQMIGPNDQLINSSNQLMDPINQVPFPCENESLEWGICGIIV
jgi:hypothetical protein